MEVQSKASQPEESVDDDNSPALSHCSSYSYDRADFPLACEIEEFRAPSFSSCSTGFTVPGTPIPVSARSINRILIPNSRSRWVQELQDKTDFLNHLLRLLDLRLPNDHLWLEFTNLIVLDARQSLQKARKLQKVGIFHHIFGYGSLKDVSSQVDLGINKLQQLFRLMESAQGASSGSPYAPPPSRDDNNSYPHLSTVPEDLTSSLPEDVEDVPLPAIEGLQIAGEAYPGRELQACGYSINGTTSCNFEWARYSEDGSVNYIEGAQQPTYLVTADDVDSCLAVEVQPLDNRKRKGEVVKIFANQQKKITCGPEMQEQIQSILSVGHASFGIAIPARFLDIWENAVLTIKAEGYSIKCSGPRGVVVTEKFSPNIEIGISYRLPTDLVIKSGGLEYRIRTTATSLLRDTIVLTLKLFKMRAVGKKMSSKKVLFFK